MIVDEMLEELEILERPITKALTSSFSWVYKKQKLSELIPKFPTLMQALDEKKKNERFYKTFRIPMSENLQLSESCSHVTKFCPAPDTQEQKVYQVRGVMYISTAFIAFKSDKNEEEFQVRSIAISIRDCRDSND
jgi:hypothetical protein